MFYKSRQTAANRQPAKQSYVQYGSKTHADKARARPHPTLPLPQRTGEQHDGRGARAEHARQELGEAVRDRQDGGQAADLGQVHAQRRVLEHGRRSVRQAVARQVEARVPARLCGARWSRGWHLLSQSSYGQVAERAA